MIDCSQFTENGKDMCTEKKIKEAKIDKQTGFWGGYTKKPSQMKEVVNADCSKVTKPVLSFNLVFSLSTLKASFWECFEAEYTYLFRKLFLFTK